MRPLEGLKVLDFSTLLPGPFATLMLAEAGAQVVKIERPGAGDDMRAYMPRWGANSANFSLLNSGKQSVTIDLKDPDARDRLLPLIQSADVLVEQFRPGVMDRLGLGYEALSAINPGLIYCSISAYGHSGPKRNAVGHDINLMAETGLLGLSLGGLAEPPMPPVPIADIAGGSYPAMINILLALRERDRDGAGRHIDIALGENLFPLVYWALADGWSTGRFPGSRDALITGNSPRYRFYTTRDGRIVAAAPVEPKFWDNFCELIDLPLELRDDARDPDATIAAIAAIIAADDAAIWAERFARCECCCTVDVDMKQAIGDPHFLARGIFDHRICNESGERMPALPLPIDPSFRHGSDVVARVPLLGEANEVFLQGADE